MDDAIEIRPFDPDRDSVTEITSLLNRAYKRLADQGMRYLASHQDDTITWSRISKGECYLGVRSEDARIVATVVFVPPGVGDAECNYYQRPGVAWFQQFAVEPDLQKRGIGSRIMDLIEGRAQELGADEIALDTATTATRLIAMYQKRGYEIVDGADWEVTNYQSVIMRKQFGD